MTNEQVERLVKLESRVPELIERMAVVEAQHAALLKSNITLRNAVMTARIRAEAAVAQPYYLGTGKDAGEHWGEALHDVLEILKKAER